MKGNIYFLKVAIFVIGLSHFCHSCPNDDNSFRNIVDLRLGSIELTLKQLMVKIEQLYQENEKESQFYKEFEININNSICELKTFVRGKFEESPICKISNGCNSGCLQRNCTITGRVCNVGTFCENENVPRLKKDNITLYNWQRFQAHVTTNIPDYFIVHHDSKGFIRKPGSVASKQSYNFRLIPGLANPELYSIESQDYPGQLLRHRGFRLILSPDDGSFLFKTDATFYIRAGSYPGEIRFESYNYPGLFIRHYGYDIWIANSDGKKKHHAPALFLEDSNWKIVDVLST